MRNIKENSTDYILDNDVFLSTPLTPAIECSLNESMVEIVTSFHEQFEKIGLDCQPLTDKTILVKSIPKFLTDKCTKSVRKKFLL